MFQPANMEYRYVGNSGLQVSAVSFGNWSMQDDYENNLALIKKCLQNGINSFDTAELYKLGKAEEMWGKVFKEIGEDREKLVISTKVWRGPEFQMNSNGSTSRKHVKQALKGSLKRLQFDYVDIVYAHGFDPKTPLEQTCRAFHEVIEDGLAFYWGVSNWDADQIFNVFEICEKYNLHKPIVCQNQYSMIVREELEGEYRKLFEKYQLGSISFSPLYGGLLTGKYLEENAEGRLSGDGKSVGGASPAIVKFLYQTKLNPEKVNKTLVELKKIAEEQLNCKITHLALAWVLKFKYASSAIFGARNVEQLEDCLKALEVLPKLDAKVQARINKILDNAPEGKFDFVSYKAIEPVRPIE